MLWQPALSVATLKPQQNIVAVVVDDSRSMATKDGGVGRRDQVVRAFLNGGLLKTLKEKFQVRLYRLGDHLERFDNPDQLNASQPATHIAPALKEVVAESATLPIGAVVLLSDGADNSGGIDLDTISEIRRQRIPIHTVGFGREQFDKDVEVEEVQMPAKALPSSRLEAQVSFKQHGYSGRKLRVDIKEGGRILGSGEITAKADGIQQTEAVSFNAGPKAGVKNVDIGIQPFDDEENQNNNKVTRVIAVSNSKPRILYMEGEPRWDYKFLRRAVEDDKNIEVDGILRTTQNKIYVLTETNDESLKNGFPTKVEDLFKFQAIILGSVEAGYFTPMQQDLIQQFVDRRGGGLLFMGWARVAGGWRLYQGAFLRSAARFAARSQEHLSSRSGLCRAHFGRARQPDLSSGRESGSQCRALEKASVPDEFPGGWDAKARCCGAGRHDRLGAQDAPAGDPDLWAGANRRVRYRRRRALADAAAA